MTDSLEMILKTLTSRPSRIQLLYLLPLTLLLLTFTPESAQAKMSKMDFWATFPRGANMSSKNPDSDFLAAQRYGIQLLRFGATGSPADFRFLVKEVDGQDDWDLSSTQLEKLKDLARKSAHTHQKIIITLAHIPGRTWKFRKKDYRIWNEKKYQTSFIEAWRTIAEALKEFENVVGYDLINEPYLQKDSHNANASKNSALLMSLYEATASAIRSVDPETPIIIETPDMASPSAMDQLTPLADAKIIYSFHYYEPFPYFSPPLNQGNYNYPGWIPSIEGSDAVMWDRSKHLKQLMPVHAWQTQNHIEPYRIYVGEFGVWRKAKGAETYLADLASLFEDFGWSWSYYAFRENDWDVADLELTGPSPLRTETPLFKAIKKHFR